jgi:hypothetical protein
MGDIRDLNIDIACTVCKDGGNVHDHGQDWQCWDCNTTWDIDGTEGRAAAKAVIAVRCGSCGDEWSLGHQCAEAEAVR